jgi:CRP-like cAMP-binding protein
MPNPMLTKLEQFTSFTPEERAELDRLIADKQCTYATGEDIVSEGEVVDTIHIVLTGLAARYKVLPDGARQIMAFLIPGDICDAEVFVLDEMDHGIVALTETRCAIVPAVRVKQLLREVSSLSEALWWSTMTDSAVLRERIIDHGRRDARERIAHLFYEMLIRYQTVGQANDSTFLFPLTQDELADATGLTPVHVNRMLRELREDGLVEFKGKMVKVVDRGRLKAVARFNPNYLHLRRSQKQESAAPELSRVRG